MTQFIFLSKYLGNRAHAVIVSNDGLSHKLPLTSIAEGIEDHLRTGPHKKNINMYVHPRLIISVIKEF